MIRTSDRKIRDLKKEMNSQKEHRMELRKRLRKAEKRLRLKNKFNTAVRVTIPLPSTRSSDASSTQMSNATADGSNSPPPPSFPGDFTGVVPGEFLGHLSHLVPAPSYIREDDTASSN